MPSSVVSSTTASGACTSGSTARVESSRSRRARSRRWRRGSAACSVLRRRARSCADGRSSRPGGRRRGRHGTDVAALDHDPPRTAMIRRWAPPAGPYGRTAETAETAAVTSGPRTSASTVTPSQPECAGSPGRAAAQADAAGQPVATASASSGSTTGAQHGQRHARYIAPVSRYLADSATARRRETVDLPEPDRAVNATTQRSTYQSCRVARFALASHRQSASWPTSRAGVSCPGRRRGARSSRRGSCRGRCRAPRAAGWRRRPGSRC